MPYLSRIHVKRCRNVRDLEIDLSVSSEGGEESMSAQCPARAFRHLILTGPNGSGKSGILEGLADKLILALFDKEEAHKLLRKRRQERVLERPSVLPAGPHLYGDVVLNAKQGGSRIQLDWSEQPGNFPSLYADGAMIGVFVSPRRRIRPSKIKGPIHLPLDSLSLQPENSISPLLLQFLVNKQFELALAAQDGDQTTAERIQRWLKNFERHMQWLAGDDKLRMEFVRDSYNFHFHRGDGYTFDLNTLADGHAAVLALLGELLLRIEAVRLSRKDFDFEPEGIIIVDEIETHLHLALQEQILPMLTELFPKFQFLVATHSAAVIASIPGALVCDLGTREQSPSEAFQGIPYGALMTGHFGISSDIDLESTRMLVKFRKLATLALRDSDQEQEFIKLARNLSIRSPILANQVWMIQQRIGRSFIETSENES